MRCSWRSLAFAGAATMALAGSLTLAADPPKTGKAPQQPAKPPTGKPNSAFGTLNSNGAATQRPQNQLAPQNGPPSGLAQRPGAQDPRQPSANGAKSFGKTAEPTARPTEPPRDPSKEQTRPATKAAEATPPPNHAPKVEDALAFTPVQKDVDYDRPSDPKQCSMQTDEDGNGWIVRDSSGQILRQFADTDGDKVVDQWAYFKDGLEVYRDIDSNHNGKVDQCRWFNTAGTRWGIDRDENGVIDVWRVISAEEVTAEVVAAIRDNDAARFERLLISPKELQGLGAGPELNSSLSERLTSASKAFRAYVGKQEVVTPETRWVYFGGSRPGIVPAGTRKSTADLVVYENVAAMVETDGKPSQVLVGAMVRVGDAWRLVDAPPADPEKFTESHVFFPAPELPNGQPGVSPTAGEPSDAERKLLADIEKIETEIAQEQQPSALAPLNAKHADLLERLANESSTAQNRAQWLRQMIDTINAAVQTGGYPNGVERLRKLAVRLKGNPDDAEMASHAVYAAMIGDYTLGIQQPEGGDYAKLQEQLVENLEKFVADYPRAPDSADAMFQIAQAHESANAEDDAKKWYAKLAKSEPSPIQKKAEGALRRLDCVGESIRVAGKDLDGRAFSLDGPEYRGNVVLIHYWSSHYSDCKRDLPQLKELLEKYGPLGFRIIGVSLDNKADELREFLSENRVPWPQIYEEGGMESRLANEMGIIAVPTMILIDKKGKVLHRNVRASGDELETELKGQLKPQVAKKTK